MDVKLGQVFSLLRKCEKIHVADWSISQGSLEDVFINVVKKYRKDIGGSVLDGI